MGRGFQINKHIRMRMLHTKKSDEYVARNSTLMEEAMIEGLGVDDSEKHKYRGHGKPNIRHMKHAKITVGKVGEAEVCIAKSEHEAARLKSQER